MCSLRWASTATTTIIATLINFRNNISRLLFGHGEQMVGRRHFSARHTSHLRRCVGVAGNGHDTAGAVVIVQHGLVRRRRTGRPPTIVETAPDASLMVSKIVA